MNTRLFGSLIVVLLVAGVAFVAIRLLVSVLGAVGQAFARLFGGAPGTDRGPIMSGQAEDAGHSPATMSARRCANARCHKINLPEARYCARCGQSLQPTEMGPNGAPTP